MIFSLKNKRNKRMKKYYLFLLTITLTYLSIISCASTGDTKTIDGITLKEAIEQSSREITQKLPAGTRVAIAAFDSENQNVSGYIIDELAGSLTDGSLEVTDRRNLAVVYKELGDCKEINFTTFFSCFLYGA
jgi:hypothetical protein